jgi:hypothetical protein
MTRSPQHIGRIFNTLPVKDNVVPVQLFLGQHYPLCEIKVLSTFLTTHMQSECDKVIVTTKKLKSFSPIQPCLLIMHSENRH